MQRSVLALICAPFAALVAGVALLTALSALGCNPHHREIELTAEGEWRDPPAEWQGRLPAADSLHPAYFENRARARRLGVCR